MLSFWIGREVCFWCFLIVVAVGIKTVGCCNWIDSIIKKTSIEIKNPGLHRRFSMDVSFEGQQRFIECQTAFRLTIPSGAYLDMDNIEYSPAFAISNAKFNVELPERVSAPVPIYIFSKKVLRKSFVFEQRIEFPLHLRYHQASMNNENAVVKFEPPIIMLRCKNNETFYEEPNCKKHLIKVPCDEQTTDMCRWINLGAASKRPVKVTVPVGSFKSADVIFAITFLVVIGCVNVIVFSSYWFCSYKA